MTVELETRKCVWTGQIKNKADLLRFVVLKDGTCLPDFNKKLDGRGFYLSNSKKMLQELTEKKKPLNKILHKDVIIAENTPQIVEQILQKKALDAINLARKSGDLVLGFEKVKESVGKSTVAFVIKASDAGADGQHKIAEKAKDLEQWSLFDIDTLSRTLNRENTVYLGVKKGPMSSMVRQAFYRYQTFLNA
jgi:hypothetical protein